MEELAKRFDEKMECSNIENVVLKQKRNIVQVGKADEKKTVFSNLEYNGYKLGSAKRRSFVLTKDNRIVKIKFFTRGIQEIEVSGYEFTKKFASYTSPIDSQLLDIFDVAEGSTKEISFPLKNLKRKLYAMKNPENQTFSFIPMQEFSDEKNLQ